MFDWSFSKRCLFKFTMEEERKTNEGEHNQSDDHEESVNEELTDQGKERLENKLNEAYSKQDDLHNKYLRVHADLENLKKEQSKKEKMPYIELVLKL